MCYAINTVSTSNRECKQMNNWSGPKDGLQAVSSRRKGQRCHEGESPARHYRHFRLVAHERSLMGVGWGRVRRLRSHKARLLLQHVTRKSRGRVSTRHTLRPLTVGRSQRALQGEWVINQLTRPRSRSHGGETENADSCRKIAVSRKRRPTSRFPAVLT